MRTTPTPSLTTARRLISLAGVLWILICLAGFVYCLVIGQFGVGFGLVCAGLVPVILDPS